MSFKEMMKTITSKETVIELADREIESLYAFLDNFHNEYQKIIDDRDKKIESLIKEKLNYKDLYEQTKKELTQLKDKNSLYKVLHNLSQQLKAAHEANDKLERDNNELKAKLYDISQQPNRESKQELEHELNPLANKQNVVHIAELVDYIFELEA